jgi:peptidoglycan/LPS O-acetylase OafA/YrhL
MLGINIDYNKRIYGFDLLRAYAIFRVVNGHGGHLLNGSFMQGFPWFSSPSGVDIFFVLSGFLIGFSFISNIEENTAHQTGKLALNFWKRSLLRILPNYYVILLINNAFCKWGIIGGSTEKFPLVLFATFTQNLISPFYDFFWESWSISVQEWFYLSFPLIIMLFIKFKSIRTTALIAVLIYFTISLVFRLYLSLEDYDRFFWDLHFRKMILSRLDTIGFGVLAAWFRYYYRSYWNRFAVPAFILGILMFTSVLYIPFNINTFYTNIVFYHITPISVALLLPLLDRIKDVKTKLGRAISHISILSYAIYLTNLLVSSIINNNFKAYLFDNGAVNYSLYWVMVIILSYFLYILVEKPFVTHGNKFLHTTRMMYKRVSRAP